MTTSAKSAALYGAVKLIDKLYFKLRKTGKNGLYMLPVIEARQNCFRDFIESTDSDVWPV